MKNKEITYFIFIAFLTIGTVSCAVYPSANTNSWLGYELPPSKISYDGKEFFEGKLSNGSMFSVFYDEEIENDATYYYNMLMQDWGWRLNGDTWRAPQNSRVVKLGYIYVNPSRGVAVYFYPHNTHSAFKVSIK